MQAFAQRTKHPLEDIGLLVTKYCSDSSQHRTMIQTLQRDERIANVLPCWVPESNQIAASTENITFSTLKKKYGYSGQFDALRNMTEDVLMNAQVYL